MEWIGYGFLFFVGLAIGRVMWLRSDFVIGCMLVVGAGLLWLLTAPFRLILWVGGNHGAI